MLEGAVQALIHSVDAVAHTFDGAKQLGRLFLHALFRRKNLGAMKSMGRKIDGDRICALERHVSASKRFLLGSVHLALDAPPDSPKGARD